MSKGFDENAMPRNVHASTVRFVVLFAANGVTVGPFRSRDAAMIWHSREGVDINGNSLEADIIPLTRPGDWSYPETEAA